MSAYVTRDRTQQTAITTHRGTSVEMEETRDGSRRCTLMFDGGATGNPGEAGCGVVLVGGDGKKVAEAGKYLSHATNNEAEYQALVLGLSLAIVCGYKDVVAYGDSLLVVNQTVGTWKVKSENLFDLNAQVKERIGQLDSFSIYHRRREHNKEADAITRKVRQTKQSYVDYY